MSMYEWAADRYDELKRAGKQRTRNKWLKALNPELLSVLVGLLGDQQDIQSGNCVRCGCDFGGELELEGGECPSDACPGYAARQICPRTKAGAL